MKQHYAMLTETEAEMVLINYRCGRYTRVYAMVIMAITAHIIICGAHLNYTQSARSLLNHNTYILYIIITHVPACVHFACARRENKT